MIWWVFYLEFVASQVLSFKFVNSFLHTNNIIKFQEEVEGRASCILVHDVLEEKSLSLNLSQSLKIYSTMGQTSKYFFKSLTKTHSMLTLNSS